MAAVFVPLANLALYYFRLSTWSAVGISLLLGIGAVVVVYSLSFFWYLCNSKYLPDPPRQLGVRRQIKMIKYLSPYGSDKPKGDIPRRFDMHYYPGVRDAQTFGGQIQDVMRRAGWAANLFDEDAIGEQSEHARGLWVYGKGINDLSPSTADLLQEAFKRAGIKVHIDQENWGIPGVNLVIGFWE